MHIAGLGHIYWISENDHKEISMTISSYFLSSQFLLIMFFLHFYTVEIYYIVFYSMTIISLILGSFLLKEIQYSQTFSHSDTEPFSFTLKLYKQCMCTCILPTYTSLHYMCTWWPQSPRMSVRSPAIGVTECRGLPWWFWEQIPGPL